MSKSSKPVATRTRKASVRKLTETHGAQQELPGDIRLARGSFANADDAMRREWLVTNGIGGFASGTVGGARTRRYHGLLVAALSPPLGRTMTLARLEVTVEYLGRRYELSANEFLGGIISPDGYKYIESFSLEGNIPTWRYAFADVLLEQRIWMTHGENTTCLQLSVIRASAPLEIRITPLVTWRDYHAQSRGAWTMMVDTFAGGFEFRAHDGAQPCRVFCDGARFSGDPTWYWNFRHRIESYRGLDDTEDLYRPGSFDMTLAAGQKIEVVASTESVNRRTDSTPLSAELRRQRALLPAALLRDPAWIRQLALAADQFIVRRGDGDGRTVIAGYPWFGDWGRDTMIAFPGLTLATGRHDIARRILTTFAEHVSEGMLPNRFPDGGETPEYNTVDATLWYFHAIDRYLTASNDELLARQLYPVLRDIIDWHTRGTRFGIRVDAEDGLLAAGEPGVQLTWMDAKVGDWVVTPRIGKPVEINALWCNALAMMESLAQRVNDKRGSVDYRRRARFAAKQFQARFWNPDRACLYDVIDGPEGEPDDSGRRCDGSLRPNQLFAVSLPATLLNRSQARAVVDICTRELYTPVGLRSLGRDDARYIGHYGGGPLQRDGAYHQGTVWSWLLGPLVTAHYRVYRDADKARSFLDGIAGHLSDGCLGQISEIFDADAPHEPRGCMAQAWSVAEVLRAWLELPPAGERKTNGEKPL